MTQEEKAKLYDELKVKAQELTEDGYIDKLALVDMFPELKECEDKMMIQYFKDLAPFDKAEELYEKYGFSHKDAIAWLEKQGEHANFRNKIQIGDKVTRNEDGVLVNLSQLNRVAKKDDKQGEQKYIPKYKIGDYVKNTNYKGEPIYEIVYMDKECYICEYRGKEKMGDKAVMHFSFDNPYLRLVHKPADKVEPKFKAGDWIYHEISGNTIHINKIEYGLYVSDEGATISLGRQNNWRNWTIQDAKDGDVLADNVGVILFRKIGNEKYADAVDYHCAVYKSGSFIIQKGLSYWGYSKDEQLRPATKEQRERFFATMHEVGYEWDAEKKELKRIEQKPAKKKELKRIEQKPAKRIDINRAIDAFRRACPHSIELKHLDGTTEPYECFGSKCKEHSYRCNYICKSLRRFIDILKEPEQ